ncbi:MAG: hypothetical protein QG661_2949 [Actinomycetota bacterium]|jgi:hypothetical protein|nr:hypothetical protein [Actinomycetota bacterium]
MTIRTDTAAYLTFAASCRTLDGGQLWFECATVNDLRTVDPFSTDAGLLLAEQAGTRCSGILSASGVRVVSVAVPAALLRRLHGWRSNRPRFEYLRPTLRTRR